MGARTSKLLCYACIS